MVYQYSTRMLRFLRLECKMQSSHPRVVNLRKQIYIHHLNLLQIYLDFLRPLETNVSKEKCPLSAKAYLP